MEERELLMLAARPAGIKGEYLDHGGYPCIVYWPKPRYAYEQNSPQFWRPLTDDGAALRLASTLKMDIQADEDQVTAWIEDTYSGSACICDHHGGWESAYRTAIVKAAAELGKAQSPAQPLTA